MSDIPIALTIAGSDPSGGAGIQADLKTFAAYGVYGSSVLTALTAQNTTGVQGVHSVPTEFITAQLESVFGDLAIGAAKTGMLATTDIIDVVVASLDTWTPAFLIVDPVMVATSGDPLLAGDAEAAVREKMLPRASLITPNIPEAARLLNTAPAATIAEMETQARTLKDMGAGAVLLKGGHGTSDEATDVFFDGATIKHVSAPWIDSQNTHGTGCTLSAAIAAGLSQGMAMVDAVASAKRFTHEAIARAAKRSVGKGRGPLIHNPPR